MILYSSIIRDQTSLEYIQYLISFIKKRNFQTNVIKIKISIASVACSVSLCHDTGKQLSTTTQF